MAGCIIRYFRLKDLWIFQQDSDDIDLNWGAQQAVADEVLWYMTTPWNREE